MNTTVTISTDEYIHLIELALQQLAYAQQRARYDLTNAQNSAHLPFTVSRLINEIENITQELDKYKTELETIKRTRT